MIPKYKNYTISILLFKYLDESYLDSFHFYIYLKFQILMFSSLAIVPLFILVE